MAFLERLLVLVHDPACHGTVLERGMLTNVANEVIRSSSEDRNLQCALEIMRTLSSHEKFASTARACKGLEEALNTLSEGSRGESARVLANDVIASLGGAENVKPKRSSGKTGPRTITVDMSGLLGDSTLNASYTHAMLLVPGVTSVTMDAKRCRALIFAHTEKDLRPDLMQAIEMVRGEDKSGLGVSKAQASYLDDEECADVFGQGAVTDRNAGLGVEARLARRRAAGGDDEDGYGLYGMAKAATSWFGW